VQETGSTADGVEAVIATLSIPMKPMLIGTIARNRVAVLTSSGSSLIQPTNVSAPSHMMQAAISPQPRQDR